MSAGHGGGAVRHRLFIVEGLPCSGKSTLARYLAGLLAERGKVRCVDEGTGDHPADWELHALAPVGMVSDREEIVPLARFSGAGRERLMPYKLYDGLPWERERPLMLDKWRSFVSTAEAGAVYVFNCVLLPNPMCETMMRFGFPEETSRSYIEEIAGIIRPMEPVVVYLRNDDIAASVRRAAAERPGWLEDVVAYHERGAYGRSVGARGFEGYIVCLRERQEREIRILAGLPVASIVLHDPQRD